MTHIRRSADCGNSPKNGLAEDVAVALETRGVDVLTPILDPEVEWHHPNGVVTSARSVADQVAIGVAPNSVTIDHVVSHGKVAAVNGTTERGQGERRFCHVLVFTSTTFKKVRRIESFDG
ncbi:MAG: hypothetical protein H0U69_14290 [Trueperaceae bacterium]|nr:hypothetical protein [Trueperaceae bacterium]